MLLERSDISMVDAFVEALGERGDRDQLNREQLAEELSTDLACAKQAWPTLCADLSGFARFLGERVPNEHDPLQALQGLAIADLYIAYGCLVGDEGAAQVFHDTLYPEIRMAVARIGQSSQASEDIAQNLYHKLFAAEVPKINSYRGEGSLCTWLRVVAARAALDETRRDVKQAPLSDSVVAHHSSGALDTEMRLWRKTYAPHFKRAFQEATADLSSRERTVLRYSLDGSTAEEIGRIYRVHRVTVARWLGSIRSQLLTGTHTRLRNSLAVSHDEADSILGLFDGELSLSLDRVLPEYKE